MPATTFYIGVVMRTDACADVFRRGRHSCGGQRQRFPPKSASPENAFWNELVPHISPVLTSSHGCQRQRFPCKPMVEAQAAPLCA
jgi:hypothetical protein